VARTVRVRLSVYLGATIEVEGRDWIKPAASADVIFESEDPSELPTDAELREKWEWLWDRQVLPQADTLIQAIMERRRAVPSPVTPDGRDTVGPGAGATVLKGGEPEGERY
jgi:hypothetical protein